MSSLKPNKVMPTGRIILTWCTTEVRVCGAKIAKPARVTNTCGPLTTTVNVYVTKIILMIKVLTVEFIISQGCSSPICWSKNALRNRQFQMPLLGIFRNAPVTTKMSEAPTVKIA